MKQRRRLNQQSTKAKPILAAVVSAALVAVTAIGGNHILNVQAIGQGTTEVSSATESFAAGANVAVDDAAIQTQGGTVEEHRVVKEFTRDTPFRMFGLTWSGERDIAAFVRSQRPDGSWSEWFEMDPADAPNGSAAQAAVKSGTEPIFVEPTTRIQVSTANVDLMEDGRTTSDAPTTANDIEAVFLDGGEGTTQGDIAPVAETYAQGMPKVVTRAQWGAGSSMSPTYTEPVEAATVHHTAGSNNYTQSEAPGIVRAIWDYHTNTMGWGDVGYNALVDKYGNIYEGRAGGLDQAVEGAHVGGFNQHTWGVSMLGDYEKAQPSSAAIQAMGEIIGWKAAQAGFDPLGSSYLTANFNFRGSKYAAGQGAMFPNINAHRDFHHNTCPGRYLYAQMGAIRAIAAAKEKSVTTGAPFSMPKLPSTLADSLVATPNTITNPNGTTTTVTNGSSRVLDTLDIEGLIEGEPLAVAAAVGVVAGVVILFAAEYDLLPGGAQTVGGIEILPDLTIGQITPYIGPILKFTGQTEAADAWEQFEPTMGKLTGATGVGGNSFAFFENGIAVKNREGEIHTMLGEIANAWLQQGLDGGPLGLPTSDQYSPADDLVRVDFEHGHVTFDPQTKAININVE